MTLWISFLILRTLLFILEKEMGINSSYNKLEILRDNITSELVRIEEEIRG